MARFLHLSNLQQTEPTGGPSLLHPNASYKLILSTYTYGDLVLSFKATNNSNHNNGGGSGNASQDRDAIEQQINKALERKAWEMATRLQQKQLADTNNNSIMTKRRVGVDHILTKNKLKHQQAQRLAEEALSGDAELLLREAGALLQVIQKYTTLLQKNKESSSSSTTTSTLGDEEDEDAQRLSIMLQDMGMTSALTKIKFLDNPEDEVVVLVVVVAMTTIETTMNSLHDKWLTFYYPNWKKWWYFISHRCFLFVQSSSWYQFNFTRRFTTSM